MNFFGHAVAASWQRTTPRFVLGAMLPDFASMLGTRVATVSPGDVADGVAWHHATDAVFHRLRAFRVWSRDLSRALADAGVARGPSLAAGHVGVELLLDGVLVDREPDLEPVYVAALEVAGAEGDSGGGVSWHGPRPRLPELAAELARRGLPVGYRDVATVAERVIRVLSRRPRLAFDGGERPILERTLDEARPAIAAGADDLLGDLRAQLA